MFVTMIVTALEMLSEHKLIAADSPIPNVGIITLLLINFFKGAASDFDMEEVYEIVRAADKYGVKLEPRTEVDAVNQEEIDLLRQECEEQEEEKKFNWKSEVRRFI